MRRLVPHALPAVVGFVLAWVLASGGGPTTDREAGDLIGAAVVATASVVFLLTRWRSSREDALRQLAFESRRQGLAQRLGRRPEELAYYPPPSGAASGAR